MVLPLREYELPVADGLRVSVTRSGSTATKRPWVVALLGANQPNTSITTRAVVAASTMKRPAPSIGIVAALATKPPA